MAEQAKQEDKAQGAKKRGGSIIKVFLGLGFLALASFLLIQLGWWRETALLIKGGIAPLLVLVGLITLAIAKE